MRNEIFEPNQTVLVNIFSIMNTLPSNIHSVLLIEPIHPINYNIIGTAYQDWNVQLDSGMITIMRMRVDR